MLLLGPALSGEWERIGFPKMQLSWNLNLPQDCKCRLQKRNCTKKRNKKIFKKRSESGRPTAGHSDVAWLHSFSGNRWFRAPENSRFLESGVARSLRNARWRKLPKFRSFCSHSSKLAFSSFSFIAIPAYFVRQLVSPAVRGKTIFVTKFKNPDTSTCPGAQYVDWLVSAITGCRYL